MSAHGSSARRIFISDETVEEAKRSVISDNAHLMVRDESGKVRELPTRIERLLREAIVAVAEGEAVGFRNYPDELTSTVAAELLHISRPTLMKWADEGIIDSFKVGSHTRFRKEEVLRLREKRKAEQWQAFNELRDMTGVDSHFIGETPKYPPIN